MRNKSRASRTMKAIRKRNPRRKKRKRKMIKIRMRMISR